MPIRYKLTDQQMCTHDDTQWKLGIKKSIPKEIQNINYPLCTSHWLHCYSNPYLALIFNNIHAMISNPRLFKVKVSGLNRLDRGLKEGWTNMTLIEELELPVLTVTQIKAFIIIYSLEIINTPFYKTWGLNWLSNLDRTRESTQNMLYRLTLSEEHKFIQKHIIEELLLKEKTFYLNYLDTLGERIAEATSAFYYKNIDLIRILQLSLKIK